MLDIGKRVRDLRGEKGLSRDALARASGMAANSIYLIESGRRPTPSSESLEKISRGLGVSVSELFTEEPVGAGKAEAPEAGPTRPARAGANDDDPDERRRSEIDPWTAYIRRRAGRIQEAASSEASPDFTNPQRAFGFVARCNEEGADIYETLVEDTPGGEEPFVPAVINDLLAALEDFFRAIDQAEARARMLKATAPEDAIAQKRAERAAEEAEVQRARLPGRLANHA